MTNFVCSLFKSEEKQKIFAKGQLTDCFQSEFEAKVSWTRVKIKIKIKVKIKTKEKVTYQTQ